ncbi:MAG: glycosyltransferase [Paludibacteraceae bacterium]|nr:glycosyltransferase [Paludibacteraceae bacterium]
MKIVYVTDSYAHPLVGGGGISRTTRIMAKALHNLYGHACYSVYASLNGEKPQDEPVFQDEYQWQNSEAFCDYIRKLGKCIIIIQIPCVLANQVYQCAACLPDAKIITAYHGAPGYELVPLEREVTRYHLRHNIDARWTLKQRLLELGMKLLPMSFFQNMLRKKYASPYLHSDRLVVLAPGVIDQYALYAQTSKDKYVAIANARSFEPVQLEKNKHMTPEVLVVARLEDKQKHLLELLQIWQTIQHDKRWQDWTLRIVGDGIDMPMYEEYVVRHAIDYVRFEGQQNPLVYYKKASIFLMTSAFEGLPMTILEAQQCGCVPILYDSFASAKDVVTDGENGFLIPYRDRTAYIAALQRLMSDSDLRKRMSEACVRSSERFSVENVAAMWNELFLMQA